MVYDPLDGFRVSETFDGDIQDLFRACDFKLEGIISKRRSSSYCSSRCGDWRKIKCEGYKRS